MLVSDTQNDFLYMYIGCSQQIFSPKKVREVQGVPLCESQVAALPRHQEEEETDKTKQAQIEQTYEQEDHDGPISLT